MQSLNNSSNVPLRGSAIYIGSWDDILKYQNVQVTLNADSDCEITYYTSNDKVYIESVVYPYVSGSNYFNSINSTSRYVYFTVRNTTSTNQTNFNFSVLYKDSPVSSGGGISSDVTIVGPVNLDGSVFVGGSVDVNNFPASFPVSGSVSVSNFPATQAISNSSLASMSFNTNRLNVLDSDANTKLTNIYNVVNSRGQAQMINGLTNNAVELPNVKSCSIYGNVSGATVLTLKFSPNGVDFYSSQYSVNMTGAGDFGFVIDGLCAKWIMFNNSNSVSAVAFVDYC